MNKRRERASKAGGGSRERQLSAHSETGRPEINTTFCILAGGRARISQCMCECSAGEGGRRRRVGEVGETEGEEAEQEQLSRELQNTRLACSWHEPPHQRQLTVCARTPLCPRAHASPFRSKNINVCVLAV